MGSAIRYPFIVRVDDQTGVDLLNLCRDAARVNNIPLRGLLACLKAESNLDPFAARNGIWPDISFGLGQQIVKFAPFGDGTDSQSNINYVQQKLFDRKTAINLCAQHLVGNYKEAIAQGDKSDLGALIVYNYGHYPNTGDSYWTDYLGNINNYKAALMWYDTLNLE